MVALTPVPPFVIFDFVLATAGAAHPAHMEFSLKSAAVEPPPVLRHGPPPPPRLCFYYLMKERSLSDAASLLCSCWKVSESEGSC